ncbi:glycine oxidase ThiO [Alkalilimnicola ehrlichii]|uniref:Glycine oxidase ThiO n=1 Tax=Alkalilimnicola ehrlichii TaxID=351052 RepID=A0A3E0WZW5_9GAMM|nr:glycine oxidase ThiO [Alkalilimnicola ehrlichii]RFA30345.1 glycine oxidase ThiO [Alkalilimnicola ehrlichii]RFA37919.1 glycine oxidase ThiO [Alkalilimnicola ehrlichii]
MADTIIVGGGIIGLLTARELRIAGDRVTVLDRSEIGCESSWAGGGILSPLPPWRYPEPVTQLALLSLPAYHALDAHLRDSGYGDPELSIGGLLLLDADQIAPGSQWATAHNVRHHVMDAQQLRHDEPYLAEQFSTAFALPGVGHIRNPRLLKALYRELIDLGVEIHPHTPVERLTVSDDRITGVTAKGKHWPADRVVIAAGSWSGALLSATGLALATDPVKGQILLFKGEPGRLQHILLHDRRYLIPRRDGHLLVGSTTEQVGFDKQPSQEAAETLRDWAYRVVPDLKRLKPIKHWAGLRPGSPDGLPTIGPHPMLAGLFIHTGHYRNGLCTAPASARLLADVILGRPPILDPTPFSAKRQNRVV